PDYFFCWRSNSARSNCRPVQNLVGALESSDLLIKIVDPLRLRGRYSRRIPVVEVGLAHPEPHHFTPHPTRHPTWAPSASRPPSPPGYTDDWLASPAAFLRAARLHPRFQGQEPPRFPEHSYMTP